MALDPTTGTSLPPGAGGFTPWQGSASPYVQAALNWSAPQYTFPDYNALLQQYMAPFRAIYEAQIGALGANIARQEEYAKKQAGIAQSDLGLRHDITMKDIVNTLQARGLSESGEPTYREGNENKAYNNAKSSIANQLQNTLAGLQYALDQAKYSGLMGLEQQQLGLVPFIQSTYQPTVQWGYGAARGGLPTLPGMPGAPPIGPPVPAAPRPY